MVHGGGVGCPGSPSDRRRPRPAGPGPDDRGRTAADLARLGGNTAVADLLAAAGARAAPLPPVDELVAAGLRGDRGTVRRLLAADPGLAERAVAAAWPNPLHQAAALGRTTAVRLLVELGFPVTDRRMSPLHTAALAGQLDVARLLVDLGADPAAPAVDDTPGQFAPPESTPLGWARYGGHPAMISYLAGVAPDPAPTDPPG